MNGTIKLFKFFSLIRVSRENVDQVVTDLIYLRAMSGVAEHCLLRSPNLVKLDLSFKRFNPVVASNFSEIRMISDHSKVV